MSATSALRRIARMDAVEIAWRTSAAARIAVDRAASAVRPPRWRRTDLARVLSRSAAFEAIRGAARRRRWDDAQAGLARHFASSAVGFPIAPRMKSTFADAIRREFPDAPRLAARRADRIIAGEYDVLGFRRLRFGGGLLPDWHADPVSNRRAPAGFWSTVPFLDPSIGDHKVIWELNRHQHWIALGRAHWLTGNPVYRERFLTELEDWLAANPPLSGINWASMLELAFRALSWTWALHLFADPEAADGTPWLVDLLVALDRQLAHIERNLSYYFSPNTHLLGEALALYVTGRALRCLAASPRREALGRRILIAEIGRQVAADGGHCERSAHYHRYTLDFYIFALVVARLTRDSAAADFERATARLAFAARLLADDTGRLPHLGDDDGGALLPLTGRPVDDIRDSLAAAALLVNRADLRIGAVPEETRWMLGALPVAQPAHAASDRITSAALPDTGYYVSRSADGTHAVIDAGPHGYQNAGHAHADALSMTLTVRRTPFVIDPGTACYTIDTALRDRMRSAALHNTVLVDGESPSQPRGPFHWERRADGRALRWRANDAFDYFDGTHDGFVRAPHRRRVLALHGDLVVVADLVEGTGTHVAHAHWHLDPRWRVEAGDGRVSCSTRGEQVTILAPTGAIRVFRGDRETGLGWYSPAYGLNEPATTIRIACRGTAPFWVVTVFDLSAGNRIAAIDPIPVWSRAGALAHATALRILRANGMDTVLFAEPAACGGDTSGDAPEGDIRPAALTWRIGEYETDARVLFCRTSSDGRVTRLALVDGSVARRTGRRGLDLVLPRIVPDFHLDLTGEPRVAGPAFGARLIVGGHEHALDVDRRATPR